MSEQREQTVTLKEAVTWKELVVSIVGLSVIILQGWFIYMAFESLGFHAIWVAVLTNPLAGTISWALQQTVWRLSGFVIPGYPSPFLMSHLVAGWVALFGMLVTAPAIMLRDDLKETASNNPK